jgi:hypothetical protein
MAFLLHILTAASGPQQPTGMTGTTVPDAKLPRPLAISAAVVDPKRPFATVN